MVSPCYGVPRAFFFDPLHDEVRAAVEAAIEVFRDLGATVRDVEGLDFEPFVEARVLVQRAEAQHYHERWFRERPGDYGASLAERLAAPTPGVPELVAAHRALDPACVLALLAERYPDCVLFAHGAGESGMWLGATPETLVRLGGDAVSSDALAGTAERGGDPAADRRIADALLASPKLALEHRLVVEAIVEALRGLCVTVDAPARPRVMALRDIQHLWTPVRGRVKPGASLFGLLARLHPTPAVGGTPGPEALDWLATAGEARSGWYTGGMGWVDREGDGEFAVVLRCALLRGTHAELFAGAGVVPDSDPARELEETEMKFGAMLEALGGACALRSLSPRGEWAVERARPSPLSPAPRLTGGIARPPGCAGVERCCANSPPVPKREGASTGRERRFIGSRNIPPCGT